MPYSTQPTKHLISPDGKFKMANSFLPCPKVKSWVHFQGQFERIFQIFFTMFHNLKINPNELCGFDDPPLSGAFICSQPGVGSHHGVMRDCSATWRPSSCCHLLNPEQEKEEDSPVPGGGEEHIWLLERAREPKPCQFMSNHSSWHFTLKPHSEECSPLEVRDISNYPTVNFPYFLYHKAAANP